MPASHSRLDVVILLDGSQSVPRREDIPRS